MLWKRYFTFLNRHLGGLLIFVGNFIDITKLQISYFYRNMLEIWIEEKEILIKKESSKINEIMLNNMFTRIDGNSIYEEFFCFLKI